MVQSLPRVVRHKLVKGCRLKDSGRALHGVGERVKAVNNKRPLGGTVGRAGQLYGENSTGSYIFENRKASPCMIVDILNLKGEGISISHISCTNPWF